MLATGFLVKEKIGVGGSGEVYLFANHESSEKIAVKFAPREILEKENAVLSQLSHPGIIKSFGIQKFGEKCGMVMEYCAVGKRKPDVTKIAEMLIKALREIHSKGFIHGDISSKNILISKQDVKLCDFGSALHQREIFEKNYVLRSSPEYLSPEIWSGAAPSFQSDFFALGLVLYEILTGKNPLKGLLVLELRLEVLRFVNHRPWTSWPSWAPFFDSIFGLKPIDTTRLLSLIPL